MTKSLKKKKTNNNNIKHGLGCIDITVVDKDVESKQLDLDQAHKMLPLIGAYIVSSWSIRDLFKFRKSNVKSWCPNIFCKYGTRGIVKEEYLVIILG